MSSLRAFGQAVALLAASRLLLRRRDTTATLRRLTVGRRAGSINPRRALKAIRRAAPFVGGVCLPQAVALTALLHRGGHDPVLVLGCRRGDDGSWTAHAWVELNGSVLEPVVAPVHATLACLNAVSEWVPVPRAAISRR